MASGPEIHWLHFLGLYEGPKHNNVVILQQTGDEKADHCLLQQVSLAVQGGNYIFVLGSRVATPENFFVKAVEPRQWNQFLIILCMESILIILCVSKL